MLMCKEVILTILIIAVALGAEAELQIRIILLGPSAESAFVPCNPGGIDLHRSLELISPLDLLGPKVHKLSA